MTSKHMVAATVALATDVLELLGVPFATSASETLKALFARRMKVARDIFLEEVSRGDRVLNEAETDEAASMFCRYGRAAIEGAARVNLRLMAQVALNTLEHRPVYASDFLRYADILASLSREEIVFLGALARIWDECANVEEPGKGRAAIVLERMLKELVPTTFKTNDEMMAVGWATTRTGLATAPALYGGTFFIPSPILQNLIAMAPFEAALRFDAA